MHLDLKMIETTALYLSKFLGGFPGSQVFRILEFSSGFLSFSFSLEFLCKCSNDKPDVRFVYA